MLDFLLCRSFFRLLAIRCSGVIGSWNFLAYLPIRVGRSKNSSYLTRSANSLSFMQFLQVPGANGVTPPGNNCLSGSTGSTHGSNAGNAVQQGVAADGLLVGKGV